MQGASTAGSGAATPVDGRLGMSGHLLRDRPPACWRSSPIGKMQAWRPTTPTPAVPDGGSRRSTVCRTTGAQTNVRCRVWFCLPAESSLHHRACPRRGRQKRHRQPSARERCPHFRHGKTRPETRRLRVASPNPRRFALRHGVPRKPPSRRRPAVRQPTCGAASAQEPLPSRKRGINSTKLQGLWRMSS